MRWIFLFLLFIFKKQFAISFLHEIQYIYFRLRIAKTILFSKTDSPPKTVRGVAKITLGDPYFSKHK
jgi:hypothetical protein